MTTYIDSDHLKRIQKSGFSSSEFKMLVVVPNRILNAVFPTPFLGLRDGAVGKIATDPFVFASSYQVLRQERATKLVLNATVYKRPENQLLHRAFLPGSAYEEAYHDRFKALVGRYRIIQGLAMTAVIPDARLVGYVGIQRVKNRVVDIHHREIYVFLKSRMTFTGVFDTDVKRATEVLWVHFPQTLTPYDTDFLRATLSYAG